MTLETLITKGVRALIKGVAKYIQDVAIVALREKSIAAAYEKVASEISETWKVIKESFVELREFVKQTITGFANNAKQLLEKMVIRCERAFQNCSLISCLLRG